MRIRIALAALALLLLPAAAHADTISFSTSSFTFFTQAQQQVQARIVSFSCSPSSVPAGINCGDISGWSLLAYDPAGALVASHTLSTVVPARFVTDLNLLFITDRAGEYRITFGMADGPPGAGLAGATWRGEITINPAVPEPATLILLSTGLVGAVWRRRRTSRAAG